MSYKIIFRSLPALALMGAFLGGCSSDSNGDSDSDKAAFKVQLSNSDSLLSLSKRILPSFKTLAAATSLTAKLGGVDLLAECTGGNPPGTCIDDGLAPDPDIWVNAGCDDDIAQCTTSNTEFFELIDPSAANTELNSQGRDIDAGTFTHVRIYLLNNDAGDALECNGAASSEKPASPITVTLPSSLTVIAGDSVTVTLSYDPSAVDCADGTSISTAFSGMTAAATKN